ncbi:MAG: hypothetical protein E7218_01360 [Anaerofustis stercorihominis]|nr:hypothetical protein [Anaerofustis stercorihominis]
MSEENKMIHDHEENEECGCGCHHEHKHHHHDEDCGCGHDHHHHHEDDEECECGCGHDHHHHHEDDEECECGCGHDHHHHEHGEDCDCGCHDHGHHLNVYTHDEAVIGSLDIVMPGTYDGVREELTKIFEVLGNWVYDKDGIIGHIKAFIESAGTGGMLSITDDEVQFHHTRDGQCNVNIATIVFGITVDELKEKLQELFKDYL